MMEIFGLYVRGAKTLQNMAPVLVASDSWGRCGSDGLRCDVADASHNPTYNAMMSSENSGHSLLLGSIGFPMWISVLTAA